MTGGRLSWPRLCAYSALAMPLSIIGLPLSIYLAPFYAGQMGLPLALVGTAMLLARFSDIVTDPLIGMISDSWQTRIGRRRPWVLIGVPALAGSVWMLFHPISNTLGNFVFWLSLTYFSFTALQLPHQAWGAELSSRYEERSRITSSRQAFSIAGLIASTVIPALVMRHAGASSGQVLHALALLMLVLLPLCGVPLLMFVAEPAVHATSGAKRIPLRRTLRQLWRNAPYRRLIIVLLLGYTAETFRITITLFFAQNIVGLTNVGVIFVPYFIAGFVFLPFWGWFGNRIGKHRALAVAFAAVALSTLAMFTLHHGQIMAFTALFLVKGLCFGSLELLPQSMMADTADVDSVLSRRRRQGQLFAASLMVVKFGQALGQFLSLGLLSLVSYHASGANDASALLWLRIAYCVVPPLILGTLVPLLWTYPLTPLRHRRFQAFVDRKFALHQA